MKNTEMPMNSEEKKSLRRQISEKKKQLSRERIEKASAVLTDMLAASDGWKNAKSVYIYLSYNSEVITDGLARLALSQGKTLAVPLCESREEMSFRIINSLDDVKAGYMGIREPDASAPIAHDETALVVMPGLAFDRGGGRMGYGGGYYDRFLEKEPQHPTAALCFDFQLVEKVPADEHDVPVDRVYWTEV